MSLGATITDQPGAGDAGTASGGANAGGAVASASGGTSDGGVAASSGRPEGLPDAFWNAETNAFNLDKLTEVSGAAEKLAKYSEGAVDDPSKVDFKGLFGELKDDKGEPLKGLDGQPIEFDPDSPLLQGAAKIFAEQGMGRAAQAALIKTFVDSQMADARAVYEAGQAERAKLGANADARIAALQNFMKTEGGDGAVALLQRMNTAAEFELLEKIMSKVTGPAAGANTNNGSAPEKTLAGTLFPHDKPRAA